MIRQDPPDGLYNEAQPPEDTRRAVKTPTTHPDHPTVGHHFSGVNWRRNRTEVYFCDSYDPQIGYWMTNVYDPADRKNVSERAIERTFHHVEEREDHWRGRSGVRFEKSTLANLDCGES